MHVAHNAKLEEIKKAFRKLAHQYHPDKNPEDTFTPAYFREIREAYQVLSDPRSRRSYDLEWAAQGGHRDRNPLTAAFLLQEAQKLSRQVALLRPYRMDTGFLFASLQYLLAADHLAVLLRDENRQARQVFLLEIRSLAALLPYHFLKETEEPLISLAKGIEPQETELTHLFSLRKKEGRNARIFPWLIALITLILCLAMFWYGRR